MRAAVDATEPEYPRRASWPDQPAHRRVEVVAAQPVRLAPRILERTVVVVVGKGRQRGIRDVAGDAPRAERLCDRSPPLALAARAGVEELLGERRSRRSTRDS